MNDTARSAPARLEIHVESDGSWPAGIDAGLARSAAEALAATIDLAGEASLLLGDDSQIRALNARYRQFDKPTNVLSFPAGPGSPQAYLGDIILARETVCREAEEAGKPLADHVAHLIVHGLLHLAGYDHETDREADEMEALEREILARLDIGDPYAESEAEER